MVETSVKVNPSTNPEAVDVATITIDDKVYPVYMMAFGGASSKTLVDGSNPMPVYMLADSEGNPNSVSRPTYIAAIDLVELLRDIRDTNKEILKQARKTNSFYREWDGDQLEE